MKLIISLLLSIVAGAALAKSTITPLEEAFQKAREQRNIDLVLPVWLKSNLYVVVAETANDKEAWFYTKSPQSERFCVTVSESEEALSSIRWPKRRVSGEQLLRELPDAIEIVVIYKDGGDYIAREHLQWYRQQLP